MDALETMTYARDGRIARVTLNRPERGNGITLEMPRELAACVERANLDPEVHVIALAGNGTGFCGGYDLVAFAEGRPDDTASDDVPEGSALDPGVIAANHDPDAIWDPVVDFQMMSRNVRGFMSLFWSEKPVVCKVHGYCVAGGTDMALCSDLLVVAEDAKIGYPPARVWGVPTTALWVHRLGPARAKRLLLTGDSLSGRQAVSWGLATDWAPADDLDRVFEELLERVARIPVSQLVMHKLQANQAILSAGLLQTQALSTLMDGRQCASATSPLATSAWVGRDSRYGTRWTSNMFVPSPCSGKPAVIPIRSPDFATPCVSDSRAQSSRSARRLVQSSAITHSTPNRRLRRRTVSRRGEIASTGTCGRCADTSRAVRPLRVGTTSALRPSV
jgi:enoyl-CoA hydratase/carnithine racemase